MNLNFVDTHAHLQFDDYENAEQAIKDSFAAGVTKILMVGVSVVSSQQAIDFAKGKNGVYAIVGVHPHNATEFYENEAENKQKLEIILDNAKHSKVVAIGEIGLDYYYENSPKSDQIKLLEYQLELAIKYDLAVNFHVRDAFYDFWSIFDKIFRKSPIRGVVHCFTATTNELDEALKRGLYVALNGIMTFTKSEDQLAAAKAVPLSRLLLETDAPFLTPKPFRGKICKPEHVVHTAKFLADLRGESLQDIADVTTKNAVKLFNL